jgi:hypothetical protein
VDSTTHIQRVPDWAWPAPRHRELEARAERIASGAALARANAVRGLRGIHALGRRLRRRGFAVVPNSNHYRGLAIDVTGPADRLDPAELDGLRLWFAAFKRAPGGPADV